jgi:hypothetical protein
VAAERSVEEGRLVDNLRAAGHRLDRQPRRLAQVLTAIRARAVSPDLHDRASLGAQVRQEAFLVLDAAPPDDVELRIVADRALDEPGHGRTLELGQVLTGEVGDQVGRGIDGSSVDAIHAPEP